MDGLDFVLGWGIGYILIFIVPVIISFITFIGIGVRLRHIRNSLNRISDIFDEFNKKINQINIEKK